MKIQKKTVRLVMECLNILATLKKSQNLAVLPLKDLETSYLNMFAFYIDGKVGMME